MTTARAAYRDVLSTMLRASEWELASTTFWRSSPMVVAGKRWTADRMLTVDSPYVSGCREHPADAAAVLWLSRSHGSRPRVTGGLRASLAAVAGDAYEADRAQYDRAGGVSFRKRLRSAAETLRELQVLEGDERVGAAGQILPGDPRGESIWQVTEALCRASRALAPTLAVYETRSRVKIGGHAWRVCASLILQASVPSRSYAAPLNASITIGLPRPLRRSAAERLARTSVYQRVYEWFERRGFHGGWSYHVDTGAFGEFRRATWKAAKMVEEAERVRDVHRALMKATRW